MSLTKQDIKDLKQLRSINAHGDAYEHACKLLGWEDLRERFARINSEHERLGGLSFDMSNQRYIVYQEMLKKAKESMQPDDYSAFYGCF